MNSREKQRKVLRASGSVVANIRQLPLYMKVINVVLAIVLALGVGSNWAYAAELIPDAPETPAVEDPTINLDYGSTATLNAPDTEGASTYEWQIYLQEQEGYVTIGNEDSSSLEVTSALLEKALDAERTASLKSIVRDSAGEQINSKEFTVKLGEEKSIEEMANDAWNDLSQINAETASANGPSEEEILGAEQNLDIEVKLDFVDMKGNPLSQLKNTFTVTNEKGFDWTIRISTELGKIYSLNVPTKYGKDLTAEKTSMEGFDDAIYIVGSKNLYSYGDTSITITAQYNVSQYYYTIEAYYQNLDGTYPASPYKITHKGDLATKIPSADDETYLMNGCPDMTEWKLGEGWRIVKEQTDVITNTNQPAAGGESFDKGVHVTVTLDREYGVLTFDTNGGVNGPSAVYLRNGEDFNTISGWKVGTTSNYLPSPSPTRTAYNFVGWYYKDGTTEISMPTTTWGGTKAPGVDRRYYARWEAAGLEKVKVTLAYWIQNADNDEFEYSIERYAEVPWNSVGSEYILPADTSQSATADQDRRFPQVRQNKEQSEVIVTKEVEYMDGTADNFSSVGYRYNDLFNYGGYQTGVIVKADGTTTVKVYLTRQTRIINFIKEASSWWEEDETWQIEARWDKDITSEFNTICQAAQSKDYCIWDSQKTNVATAVLKNMPKYRLNATSTSNVSDNWTWADRGTSNHYLNYYLHNGENKSTGEDYPETHAVKNPACVNCQPTGEYAAYWKQLVEINTDFNYTTADEFVAILGFETPVQGVDGPTYRRNFDYNDHFCYFYKRATFGLYLRNIHGVNDNMLPSESDTYKGKPYHQDLCVAVGSHFNTRDADETLRYEKTAGNFKFLADEKAYPKEGVYLNQGYTGIKKDMKLKDFIPTVPNTTDTNFVFDGWYTDPNYEASTKVDLETWKIPNHEQDLFARWVPPNCKLEFITKDAATGQESPMGTNIHDNMYLDPIDDSYIPSIDPQTGFKFETWYYYASEEDMTANPPVKSWFDPETMTMPCSTWAEQYVTDPETNAQIPVLTFHQQWLEDKDVNYKFEFKLDNGDGTYTEISAPVTGRSQVPNEVEYDTAKKTPESFYEGYVGVVKLRADQEAKHTITLDYDESKNTYTFYYVYDNDQLFHYRVEYYSVDPTGQKVEFIESEPAGKVDEESGWADTGESHKYSVTIKPDVNRYSSKNLTLYSASTMTITLRSDYQREDPTTELHPKQNIIEVYYAPDKDVNFTYKTITYDNMTDKNVLNRNGGHVTPTSQTGVNPFSGVGSSTGFTHPGFKFEGWYHSTNGVPYGDKLSSVTVEGDTATLTVPKPYYIYIADEEYTAVYIYDTTPFNITYQTSIIDAQNHPVSNSNTTLKYGSDTASPDPITKTFTNALTAPLTVAINSRVAYYPYVNWTDADGTEITAEDQPFSTPALHYDDGIEGGYDYWVAGTYTCNFNEAKNGPLTLTYKVNNNPAEEEAWGNVRLNRAGSSPTKTTNESIYPYLGNPDIGTTDVPAVYSAIASPTSSAYKFTEWTRANDPNFHCTTALLVPAKVQDTTSGAYYYVADTYTAHFDLAEVEVTIQHGDNGTLEEWIENPPEEADVITLTAGSSFKIDAETGVLNFYAPDDTAQTNPVATRTPYAYIGYKVDYPSWKKVVAGAEQDMDNLPVYEDKTFRVKFTAQDDVVLNYYAVGGSSYGYLQEAGGSTHAAQISQDIVNPATCDNPAVVTAYPYEGYKVDYWTIDSPDGDHITGRDTAPVEKDKDPKDASKTAFQSHDYYAHFSTFEVTVTIKVYTTEEGKGYVTENGEGEGTTVTVPNVTTMTPYSCTTDAGGGDDSQRGIFSIGGSAKAYAFSKQIESAWPNDFSHWMIETNPETHATTGLPSSESDRVIKGNITFVAFFTTRGNTAYHIRYYFETLNSAKTGTDPAIPDTNPDEGHTDRWANWEQYLGEEPDPSHWWEKKDDGVAGRSYPNVDGQAAAGSSVTIPSPQVIGFSYTGTFSDPALSGTTWIISGADGAVNTFYVFYERAEEYPFEIDCYTETIQSAQDNPTKSPESIDRKYNMGYALSTFTWPKTPGDYESIGDPLMGIYGDTMEVPFYLYSHSRMDNMITPLKFDHITGPGTRTDLKDVYGDYYNYTIGSYGNGDIGEGWDKFVQIDQTTSTQKAIRTKADSPNMGVLNFAMTRYTKTTFCIEVYKQNVKDGGYKADPDYRIEGPDFYWHKEKDIVIPTTSTHYTDLVGICGEYKTYADNTGKLLNAYNPAKWNDVVIDPSAADPETLEHALRGFNIESFSPAVGQIELTSYDGTTTSTPPTLKLYYARTNNNPYKIEFYQETLGSAAKRFAQTTTAPDEFAHVVGDDEQDVARLDWELDLTTSTYKDKYNDDGFAYYLGDEPYKSDTKLVVEYADNPSDPPTAKIYYIRNLNTSFRVQYYKEKVDSTDKSQKANYDLADTRNLTGITDLHVYTDSLDKHASQPDGLSKLPGVFQNDTDFRIRIDDAFKGFNFEPTLSEPVTTATDPRISYGLTISIYYSRATDIDWKVEYYQQNLNASGVPINAYTHIEADDLTTTTTPTALPKGATGRLTNFTSFVTSGKYDGFKETPDHVTVFEGTGAERTVTSPYNITIDGQGRSVARVYYNRDTNYTYHIQAYAQTVNADGTLSGNYEPLGTVRDEHGVFGATVTLSIPAVQGYKAATDTSWHSPYWPNDGKIVIGQKYSYGGQEDTETIGRIFYDPIPVNYTLVLKKETRDSAIARRNNHQDPFYRPGETPETNVFYDEPTNTPMQAFSTYQVNVNEVVKNFQETNPGFYFFKSTPALDDSGNTYAPVLPDGSTKVEVCMTRATDRNYVVSLYRESLDHAKQIQGAPEYEDNPDVVTENDGVTGEVITLQTKYGTYYSSRGKGFHYHESSPTTITIPADGTVTGMVGFYRDVNWSYKVGYRVERLAYVEKGELPQYETYTDSSRSIAEWNTYANAIYGDTISQTSKAPGGADLRISIPGFTFSQCSPESILIDENTPEANRQIEFQYSRNADTRFYLQVKIQGFDENTQQPTQEYTPFGFPTDFTYYTGGTIDKEDDVVKNYAAEQAATQAGLVGFRYANKTNPPNGITVKADSAETLYVLFDRKGDQEGDNKFVFRHYKETFDSVDARVDKWTWDKTSQTWITPTTEDFVYDTQYADEDSICGHPGTPLWTGATITLSEHIKAYSSATDPYYGFNFEQYDPSDAETMVVTGDATKDIAKFDYSRRVSTVLPVPVNPWDGDEDYESYGPVWDPDAIPVPFQEMVTIVPDPEEYVVPIFPDPYYPEVDFENVQTKEVYYTEKNIGVAYLVSDSALGSVDPAYEKYGVITGLPIGSSATVIGGATFDNWTNEAGEVVSTDLNYLPEKYPIPEPELAANGVSNASYDEIYVAQVYTANFTGGGVAQTGDNIGFIFGIILLIIAVNAGYFLYNRKRYSGKHIK